MRRRLVTSWGAARATARWAGLPGLRVRGRLPGRVLGLGLGLVLAVGAAVAADRTPKPVIEPATGGATCVEPADQMRRNHMAYLKHQRDDTVRGGVRGAKYSLKACIDCHASRQTASVNLSAGNFCVSCHQYAAVQIDCFQCHTGQSPKLARQAQLAGATPGSAK